MKKYCVNKVLCLAFIALAVLTFASCGDDFDFENHYPGAELKKEYAQNWVDLYGAIDPNQNWSMAQDTCVTVTVGASSNVKVYGKFDGIFKLVAEYDNLEGTASIPFSVVKGSEELYVSDGTMAVKTKIGGHVDFSAPATRGAFLPTSNPSKDSFTDSNGKTHTIEFELLDKSQNLKIDYQSLKSAIGSLAKVSPNSTGSNYSNVVVTDFTCVATEGEVIIYPINWINNENKELGIYLNGNKDKLFPLYQTHNDDSRLKMTLSYQLTEGGEKIEVGSKGHEAVDPNAKYVHSPGIKITVPVGTVIGFYAVKSTGNKKGYSYSESTTGHVATTDVNGTTLVGLYQKDNCSDFLFYAKNVTTITNKLASWYIACEDLGSTGDYDFNDLVFKVSTSSKTTCHKGYHQTKYYYTIKPVAAGGTKKAEFSLDEGKTWTEIHGCFKGCGTPDNNGRYTMINTNAERLALSNGSKGESGVSLANPDNWNTEYDGKVSDLFAHFKIKVEDNGAIVIDSPETGTAPQMILTPDGWKWPKERESIEVVYKEFKNWSQNAKIEDWNNVKVKELVYQAP